MARLVIHPGLPRSAKDVAGDIVEHAIRVFASEAAQVVFVVIVANPIGETMADAPYPRTAVEIGEYPSLVKIIVDRMIVPVEILEQCPGQADAWNESELLIV